MFRQIAASASEPSAYAPVESGQKPRWKISPAAFRAPTAQYVPITAATPTPSSVPQRSGPIPSFTITGSLLQAEPARAAPRGAGRSPRASRRPARLKAAAARSAPTRPRRASASLAGPHDLDERGLRLRVVDVGRPGVAAAEHGAREIGDEGVRLRVAAVDAEEERAPPI